MWGKYISIVLALILINGCVDPVGQVVPSDVIDEQNPSTISPNTTLSAKNLLSITVAGQGFVEVEPDQIEYEVGTTVFLRAVPENDQWIFNNWSGDITGTDTVVQVVMDTNKTISANFNQVPNDLVLVDGGSIGNGSITAIPSGVISGTGLLYPKGTNVTFYAIPSSGWYLSGWYSTGGVLVSSDLVLNFIADQDKFFVAMFAEEIVTQTSPTYLGAYIVAQDGKFLGVISNNSFDMDSLANLYGNYGSKYSIVSIWNQFSNYGSQFAQYSAYNPYSAYPPIIFQGDQQIGYLTKNTFKFPAYDPDVVAAAIGRYDAIRN
jgi:hypothetical protein